jgi:deoxyxylulose-5-phosphate synthase
VNGTKTEKMIARLQQSIRETFENDLLSVYESRGVYYVSRQRDHDHPESVRTLKAIGTTSQPIHEIKKSIKEWAAECDQ